MQFIKKHPFYVAIMVFSLLSFIGFSILDQQTIEYMATDKEPFNLSTLIAGKKAITPEAYGAKGNGKADDTKAINKAVQYAASINGYVKFSNKKYMVNAVTSIKVPSDSILVLSSGTILKAIPNNARHYAVINIDDVKNVVISGGSIVGERYEHLGTSGEWGHGIKIGGSKNVIIDNVSISQAWGDGIDVLNSNGSSYDFAENILIENSKIADCRRQGISIESVKGIVVRNVEIRNISGTLPSAGIDIEPWNDQQPIQDVLIQDVVTIDSQGSGILIYQGFMGNKHGPMSITIERHKDIGSVNGIFVAEYMPELEGTITIRDSIWSSSLNAGFVSHSAATGMRLVLDNNTISNPRKVGMKIGSDSTADRVFGNAVITNTAIIADNPSTAFGTWLISAGSNGAVKDVIFTNTRTFNITQPVVINTKTENVIFQTN